MVIVEGHLSEHKNKNATAEEIRFTRRGNNLYATVLDWPDDGVVRIKSLPDSSDLLGDIKRIGLLGHKGTLSWRRNAEGLSVNLPEERPCSHAFVLKIRAQGI
jgi:alpha-L-fucosidase